MRRGGWPVSRRIASECDCASSPRVGGLQPLREVMCWFWSYDVWPRLAALGVRWYMRLDDDAFIDECVDRANSPPPRE